MWCRMEKMIRCRFGDAVVLLNEAEEERKEADDELEGILEKMGLAV